MDKPDDPPLDEISILRHRVETLEQGLRRLDKVIVSIGEKLRDEIIRGNYEHEENLARIMGLESQIFPNLANDLSQLDKTIGPLGGPIVNPLDLRKK